MSVPDDPFDFATLLRREAARNERTQSADSGAVAAVLSLQSDGEIVVPPLADSLAPNPIPLPPDASLGQRNVAALTTPFAGTYRRLTTLWPPSFSLPRAPDAPLFGIISGGAAFILIAGTVIISLVQHSGGAKLAAVNPQPVKAVAVPETTPAPGLLNAPAPTPSRDFVDAETKIERRSEGNPPESAAVVPASVKTLAPPENPPSELPKLAAMYSQPVAAQPIPLPPIPPGPPAAQRGASATRAATETTASLAPGTPPVETKAARAEATQPQGDDASRRKRDQKPAKAVETPIPPVPPTAPKSTSPSRTATETTASLAPSTPAETKAAPRADATQPRGDDATQHKRDQKAAETSSCTAGVLPGSGGSSARAKPVDAQKMCSDPQAPFMVSVRCLVAAVVCSDYHAERPGKVAQKASAPNRAPSHPAIDTKPEAAPDAKPDTKSH